MSDDAFAPKEAGSPKADWRQEILKPVAVLFIVGLVVTALLAWVYQLSAPIIQRREAQELALSLKGVLPLADEFSQGKSRAEYESEGVSLPENVSMVYHGEANGVPVGVAIVSSPRGYAGEIVMLVGVSAEGGVNRISVLRMNETPGLGSRAKEESFLGQFSGLTAADSVQVVKTAAGRRGDIQGVTGATVSSRAVTQGVNDALYTAQKLAGKEGR